MSWEERRDRRATRPIWCALPTKNPLDRATATLPKLLSERMAETGLDFTILYPSVGLLFHRIQDEEVRRACCRAMNRTEEDFRDFVFVNPVTLWTGMNPAFFAGTAVEKDVYKPTFMPCWPRRMGKRGRQGKALLDF